ncbi:MAG: AAA family ATPase [Nanoarchaeota archaeon]|nr:AAA family ATPase [Nanoarchaeota archaeon]
MGMFKDILGSDETLFKNPVALDYDFIPKLIPYREKEQRQFAAAIKPLFAERNGRNVLVVGKPGVGKTVALKHVLQELEEETDDIIPIYINCWQKNTAHKIILELCDVVGYKFTQNRRTDELFDMVKASLNKKACVLILDEIDKLEDYDFLYDFLESIYRKSVFVITNFKEWITQLDERIKSRLTPVTVEFLPYSLNETKGILDERAKLAFYPAVLEEDALNAIIEKTYNIQDIRSGIFLLKESGNFAEEEASKKIKLAHARKAIQKLEEFSIKKKENLDDDNQMILSIVRQNDCLKSTEVFTKYQQIGGKAAYRTFQRKLDKLADGKFITLTKKVGGTEGTTTIVSIGRPEKETSLNDF